jgi:hypothetical protein
MSSILKESFAMLGYRLNGSEGMKTVVYMQCLLKDCGIEVVSEQDTKPTQSMTIVS